MLLFRPLHNQFVEYPFLMREAPKVKHVPCFVQYTAAHVYLSTQYSPSYFVACELIFEPCIVYSFICKMCVSNHLECRQSYYHKYIFRCVGPNTCTSYARSTHCSAQCTRETPSGLFQWDYL